MASILSAGTSSGTALNLSGDTSGILQLASNNGTTAVTIDTAQKATFVNDASISGLTVGKGLNATTYNTAFGVSALSTNTSGGENTAVGYFALKVNTTGTSNTGIGVNSLVANTTGNSNVGVGENSLAVNTSGTQNVAIGQAALISNTTASNNTAVGYQAGFSNTTNNWNTFIGSQAGYNTTGGGNTFVGVPTAIGTAGYYVTTGTKNTILGGYNGNQGGLDIRTASNYIVLSDGDGNPRGVFDNSGEFFVGGFVSGISSGYGIISTSGSAGAQCITLWNQGTSGNRYYGWFGSGSTFSNNGSIYYNGTLTVYATTSDQRLKENIVDSGSGLAKLANVKIRAFDWKESKLHTDFGVVAQELHQVAPECVGEGTDKEDGSIDKPWQVDTAVLVPAMIKAIQELNAEVTALKAKLGA